MIISLLITAAAAGAAPTSSSCEGATTPEVNACLAGKLERAESRLEEYLQAAADRYGEEEESAVRLGIRASQDVFKAYRSIECGTVYEAWKEGTIRSAMSLSCATDLTDQRTRHVWRHWLQYMDSTPPILPEPKPTE